MIRLTLARPGGILLLVGLTGEDLDTLADGGGFEIDLAEHAEGEEKVTHVAIMAKATDADLREELAPLLAKAKPADTPKGETNA